MDYSLVELLVTRLVPVLSNICQSDCLGHLGEGWHCLWEPLQQFRPPSVPIATQPCSSCGPGNSNSKATFMDVAVVRTLSLANWDEDCQVWSLSYISRRLLAQYSSFGQLAEPDRPLGVKIAIQAKQNPSNHLGSAALDGTVDLSDYVDPATGVISIQVCVECFTLFFVVVWAVMIASN